ncbi:hypothetical protein [Streptomyces sp. B3I8]|uniref:hypothetical protein n=1 Tax=Streptomyces sp. B3I8 TaxID=3042303 RepID=UPI002788A8FF|nr:hypothetical protein [Streptomyces sp. B3I8]MDQ0791495.1 hypothetical protein [Streptomyces sp. B3I8]
MSTSRSTRIFTVCRLMLLPDDPAVLAAELGEPLVVTPLGPGNFTGSDGHEQLIRTQAVTAAQIAGADLLDAPFLAQKLLIARIHLRIVTVADCAWTAGINADGLPVDRRQVTQAHRSFTPSSRWRIAHREPMPADHPYA